MGAVLEPESGYNQMTLADLIEVDKKFKLMVQDLFDGIPSTTLHWLAIYQSHMVKGFLPKGFQKQYLKPFTFSLLYPKM